MAKGMTVGSKTPGLKALAAHRHLGPQRRFIPKDADGAYRVEGRKDGVSAAEVLKLAREAS